MRHLYSIGAVASLAVLAVGYQGAQQTKSPQQTASGSQFTVHSYVSEVLINATVFDKQHHIVPNLPQSSFSVLDNGIEQTLDLFSNEDGPVSVGIVIDNSGSMSTKRAEVSQAALNFVRASNPQDEDFIIDFNEDVDITVKFTNRVDELQKALDKIDAHGSTALYDAILEAADYQKSSGKHDKRVLLVITDGLDDASSHDLPTSLQDIQTENAPLIYCVGLLDENSHEAKKALQEFADVTGGAAYFPKNLDQVDAITRQIASEIRQQYTLEYHPSAPVSGYHSIKIAMKEKKFKDLLVHGRTGYFKPANTVTSGN